MKKIRIALIGYGAMGRLIRTLAEEKGHEIAVVIDDGDAGSSPAELARKLKDVDVALDFTTSDAVPRNVGACVTAGVPIVEGTTGWSAQRAAIEKLVLDDGGTMVFAANFSIGVNLFYRMVAHAAEIIAKFPDYEIFIEEQHHSRKKDAPSGTALKLKDIVGEYADREISVSATRAGNIPGTHRVGFDGAADQILLEHNARSRQGFALGALLAAEWVIGKKGFYEFNAVIDEVIGK